MINDQNFQPKWVNMMLGQPSHIRVNTGREKRNKGAVWRPVGARGALHEGSFSPASADTSLTRRCCGLCSCEGHTKVEGSILGRHKSVSTL